ncbi:hypothetical protein ERJ75_000887100 [Trypanosoma vivax]|nr:hypothetical protein ERJ75_000887100 [Trypanosoma vivax]
MRKHVREADSPSKAICFKVPLDEARMGSGLRSTPPAGLQSRGPAASLAQHEQIKSTMKKKTNVSLVTSGTSSWCQGLALCLGGSQAPAPCPVRQDWGGQEADGYRRGSMQHHRHSGVNEVVRILPCTCGRAALTGSAGDGDADAERPWKRPRVGRRTEEKAGRITCVADAVVRTDSGARWFGTRACTIRTLR